MAKLKMEGIHPLLDGEYDFDQTYLTNWELHAIKMATGLTAGDVEHSLENRDNDANVALALVALMRHGKITTNPKRPWDSEEMTALWEARVGFFTAVEEDDASPPEIRASDESASESVPSSGDSSWPGSESPENGQSPTGSRLSETPTSVLDSDREILAT